MGDFRRRANLILKMLDDTSESERCYYYVAMRWVVLLA